AYNNVGGFEGQGSDSGLELGKQFTFQYALLPHSGDWRQANVYRAGLEFNNPLIIHKDTPHAGSLPKEWGLVEVSPANVVMSALKPSRDETTLIRSFFLASGPGWRVLAPKLQRVHYFFDASVCARPWI